jgi:hypothetical protein
MTQQQQPRGMAGVILPGSIMEQKSRAPVLRVRPWVSQCFGMKTQTNLQWW